MTCKGQATEACPRYAGVTLTLTDAFYDDMDCDAVTWPGHLSDHAAVRASFTVTVDRTLTKAPAALEKERVHPLRALFDALVSIGRTLRTVIVHLPDLRENRIGWLK